jgi:hypothetical protein
MNGRIASTMPTPYGTSSFMPIHFFGHVSQSRKMLSLLFMIFFQVGRVEPSCPVRSCGWPVDRQSVQAPYESSVYVSEDGRQGRSAARANASNFRHYFRTGSIFLRLRAVSRFACHRTPNFLHPGRSVLECGGPSTGSGYPARRRFYPRGEEGQ